MMECWVSIADDGQIFISDECLQNNKDLIPPSRVFQHSIIPVSRAFEYGNEGVKM